MPDHTQPTQLAEPDLIKRDYLAAARTALANERTLLAYVRTALSLVIAGAFFVKFVDRPVARFGGWASAALGLIVLAIGLRSFRNMRGYIRDNVGEVVFRPDSQDTEPQ